MSAPRKRAMARSAYRAWWRDMGRAGDLAMANSEECHDFGIVTHRVDFSKYMRPVDDAWQPVLRWARHVLRGHR